MKPSTPKPCANGDSLKTREYFGYALGDTASNFFFQTFSIFLTFSASLFSIKTGAMVGGFLLPLFLLCFGFKAPKEGVETMIQTPKALLGITLAFSIAPGLIALLKAGALMVYPLSQKRVTEIEQALAERRSAASPDVETS